MSIRIAFLWLFYVGIVFPDNSFCNKRGNKVKNVRDCICTEGFITHPVDNAKKCNYELKSEKVALFLSFFAGFFGADMFYLGYNYRGAFKSLLPILMFALAIYYKGKISSERFQIFTILFPIGLLIMFWLIDIYRISSMSLLDAKGFALLK